MPSQLLWGSLYFLGASLLFIKVTILGGYFLFVLLLGLFIKKKDDHSQYFLADRGLHPIVLVGTLCATNFSAFTIFGASGAGYRDGLSYFPIMAFGTGFMALSFWLLGPKIWELGKKHGLVTPAELVGLIYGNKFLSVIFALVMVVFTVPYLALQPLAAGKVMGQLFDIPHYVGAIIITFIIVFYTMRGGLKAVAITDVFQGALMLILMVAALVIVTNSHGGFVASFDKLLASIPESMQRPGLRGVYTPQIWFSFIVLWFFCDPIFPQIFQRFYAAKSPRHLKITTAYYPIICTVIFFLPIAIGALGRLTFSDLGATEADNIMALLMGELAGPVFGTLVLTAGIAALMSTMDSQLLTLSSIFTRDLYPLIKRNGGNNKFAARIFIMVLAISGLLVAIFTDGTILKLGLTAFTGLSVLFPTVFFGLYLKNPRAHSAIASIVVGEIVVFLYHFKLLSAFGFLPAIPVILSAILVYLIVQVWLEGLAIKLAKVSLPCYLFTAIFIASMDFWNWHEVGSTVLGLPLWVYYFVTLSVLQTIISCVLLHRK